MYIWLSSSRLIIVIVHKKHTMLFTLIKNIWCPAWFSSMQEPSLMLECRKNQPPNGCDPSEGPPPALQTFPNFLVVLDREREALPRIGKEGGDRADAGGARPPDSDIVRRKRPFCLQQLRHSIGREIQRRTHLFYRVILVLYRARLKGFCQVWWILFLLLLTTSA